MSRRGQISKRDVLPDPLYNSKLVTKLVNNVMLDGKKGVAQKIVYDAFKVVEEKSGKKVLLGDIKVPASSDWQDVTSKVKGSKGLQNIVLSMKSGDNIEVDNITFTKFCQYGVIH